MYVCDTLVDLLHRDAGVVLAGKAAAGAVAAVHGALVSDQQQAAVGIAVGQTGSGGVLILVQGVQQVGGGLVQLLGGGNGLEPDGVVGIAGLDQGQVIGGDGHAEGAQAGLDAFLFLRGELHVLFQVLKGLDAVFDLPMPVVPLFIGHVGKQDLAAGLYHNKVILSKSVWGCAIRRRGRPGTGVGRKGWGGGFLPRHRGPEALAADRTHQYSSSVDGDR